MASHSPWKWNSSLKTSLLISIHPFIFTHRHRSSFTFPHNHHPSTTSPNNAASKLKNSDKQFQIREIVSKIEQLPKKKKPKLSYKSLFGKRALWRSIFFSSKKVQNILLLNVLTLIYASDIPVLKEVEAIMDPASFTVVRFVVSAIPFLPFAWRSWGDVQTRHSGIELGFWVSLGHLMQAFGLMTSDAGRASFISMFTVIVVPLIDGMLGTVIPARTWFGALMSIIGVGMLECSGSPPCVSFI